MRSAKAFTLIELLVVVAVIAILAAILLPAISKARQQSRAANCQQHLRQLGMIVEYYRNDFTFFPAHQWKLAGGAIRLRWFTQFERYCPAGNKDVMRCPSRPEWLVGRNNSYGYNFKYLGSSRGNTDPAGPTPPFERFPVRAVEAPSATIAFADSDGTGTNEPYEPIPETQKSSSLAQAVRQQRIGNHGYTLDPPYLPAYIDTWCDANGKEKRSDGDYQSHVSDRHNNGANIVFVDGHVRHMVPRDVYKDNALWNGLGVEDPARDDHVVVKAPNFRY